MDTVEFNNMKMKIYIVFSALLLSVSCSKPDSVCYECTATGVHEYFIDTDQKTMQHTIDWWAENGITLTCKQIKP